VPRPIAWVSTLCPDGSPNLAPFSFFNGVSSTPLVVMFSISSRDGEDKDTLRNARATGEFVLNVVNAELVGAMYESSQDYAYGTSEFDAAGLATLPSIDVRPPRVARAPVAMEARVTQIIPVQDSDSTMVLGRIVRFHVRRDLLSPRFYVDPVALCPIARLGGGKFARIQEALSAEQFDGLVSKEE
jgi:flavin reductase (DIM6/NTAB) family NADH-FMN oxidoreductase RutF